MAEFILLWGRPPRAVPFRPRASRSMSTVHCSILLLISGDVEINPGPSRAMNYITLGSLNARSAICHTAESLDVLALCETWTRVCVPDAANMDFVPAGYDCINVSRTDGRRGGGLVVL